MIKCSGCGLDLEIVPKPLKSKRKSKPKKYYCKSCQSAINRDKRLQRLFNITSNEYNKILVYQNNVCAICLSPPKNMKLAVDHRHGSGLISGLLCWQCNNAIAKLRDDVGRAKRAYEYLNDPPVTKALGEPRYGLKGRVTNKAKTRRKLNKKD